MSIAELLAVLYGKQMHYDPNTPDCEDRDWLVVSKGHAGPAVYSALSLSGFFPKEKLLTLNRGGTNLPSHCDRNRTIGVDMTTGSLGQGASLAAGVAKAFQLFDKPNTVYLVLGDGELNEGQVWEMALFAAHQKLSNLIAFVDKNGMQLDGRTEEICDLGDVAQKFRSFGWKAMSVDGHDVESIDSAINLARAVQDSPTVIVLNTVKGKGWSGSEGKLSSHSMSVSAEQLNSARDEINKRIEAYES